MNIPHPEKGESIKEYCRKLREAILASELVDVSPPLYLTEGAGGKTLTFDAQDSTVVVRITGGASGGEYPAKIQIFNPVNNSFTDGNDCKVILI